MDLVHDRGPWTRSMKLVHGPGPKGGGSWTPGPCFVLTLKILYLKKELKYVT